MTQAIRPAYQKHDVNVHPSAIDGQGVFAAEPIAAHRKIVDNAIATSTFGNVTPWQ